MKNIKAVDNFDFIFINKPPSEKDELAFSEFLALRKKKNRIRKVKNKINIKVKTFV